MSELRPNLTARTFTKGAFVFAADGPDNLHVTSSHLSSFSSLGAHKQQHSIIEAETQSIEHCSQHL